MGQIYKGEIASLSDTTARVVPLDAGAKPTAKIVIPWHLRGGTGNLKKGTEVVYVEFDDATGLLLGRADGNWGEYLPRLEADQMEADNVEAGTVLADVINGGEGGGGGGASDIPIMSKEEAGIAKVGENLKIDAEGRLSVDTANAAEKDNTKPITSAAVQTVVGTVDILLETI